MTRSTVNVNELTYGIELELLLPAGTVTQVGGHHCGVQVPELPQGWRAERDSSIRGEAGFEAVEIVSPILKGADGVAQIELVCQWLARAGAKVNRSTGFHVHVGFDRANKDGLRRLVSAVANFEQALFASTGTRERERGQWCRTVRSNPTYQRAFRDAELEPGYMDRYHVLNLQNLLAGTKPTVEFRAFAGTTNLTKILAHVCTCLGLVEKAISMKKLPKWIAKTPKETSPIHRKGGEGQTELTRLFYFLGWTHGREEHTFGRVTTAGAPSVEDLKKELMRLAKRYDERPAAVPTPAPAHYTTDHLPTCTGHPDHAAQIAYENGLRRGMAVRFLVYGHQYTGAFERRGPRRLYIQGENGRRYGIPRTTAGYLSTVHRVVMS